MLQNMHTSTKSRQPYFTTYATQVLTANNY